MEDKHQAGIEEADTDGEWDVLCWEEDDQNVAEDAHLEQQDERDLRQNTVLEAGKVFIKMTNQALKRLKRVFTGSIVVKEGNFSGCRMYGADLDLLRSGVWLNDEVVYAYLELLVRRT